MKHLKVKIDELDVTKVRLTDISVQKDTLQNQWNDVSQVRLFFVICRNVLGILCAVIKHQNAFCRGRGMNREFFQSNSK